MKTFLATFGVMNFLMMLTVILAHIFDPLPAQAPGLRYIYLQFLLLVFTTMIYGGIYTYKNDK